MLKNKDNRNNNNKKKIKIQKINQMFKILINNK